MLDRLADLMQTTVVQVPICIDLAPSVYTDIWWYTETLTENWICCWV